jgi:DNA-binding transcriptional regulator YiaG
MATQKWSDIRKKKLSPEQLERVDRQVAQDLLEMDLRDLRESLGLSQAQVAAAAEMTQPELSRAEKREDHRVSTLRRIVKALGGDLELVARFGDRTVKLGS